MSAREFTIKNHNGTEWEVLYPKTSMTQVEGLNLKMSEVEAIAKGAARARTFDTVAELDAWLAVEANKAELQVGDNLYVRDTDAPDFWWDGVEKMPLGTEKVVLENASATADGLMSQGNYVKLSGIESGAQINTVVSVAGQTGAVTLAKDDVGLSNVDNTADANKNVASAAKFTIKRKINNIDFDGTADIMVTAEPTAHTHVAADLNVPAVTLGTTAPVNPKVGDIWYDFNNN